MNYKEFDDGLASEWDELLRDGLVTPPANFQASVMYRVQNATADVDTSSTLTGSLSELLQSTAVLVAAIAAGWQTLAFVFGLWATAVAL